MATGLARAGRVDFDYRSTSLCRFEEQQVKERRSGRVSHAFGQATVAQEAIDLQVFSGEKAVGIHGPAAVLVRKVLAPQGNALVHPGHRLAMPKEKGKVP